jgi:hypothetical protein
MLSLLEFKEYRAGPGAIGFFGLMNGCHLSLLDQATANESGSLGSVNTLVEETDFRQEFALQWCA